MYTQTYNWNISGTIHKKLLAVAASAKLGSWVARGESFRFYLKPF